MTGSFLCILLMTAKDSALPPPTPCPVSLFHTGQRYFFSALMLPATGHSYSWELFFSAIACGKKKKQDYVAVLEAVKVTQTRT